MSDLRDPKKGVWVVFEGDKARASLGEDGIRLSESVHREIEWPLCLRVIRSRDGIMESRDVEINEDLTVNVKQHERYDLKAAIELEPLP